MSCRIGRGQTRLWILFAPLSLCFSSLVSQEVDLPVKHVEKSIEGWTIHVDQRLTVEPNKDLGKRALALLRSRLADIVMVMQSEPRTKLQEVPIWLDLDYGDLASMQYHPSVDWLVNNGYSAELAKCVHIPIASQFIEPRHQQTQPWCVLHELAHAYHDQVLDFQDARIVEAWKEYVDSHHGDRALHVNGKAVRHYALTNQKEFFAEMTEAYFGTNDFFPFVQGELRQAEPAIYELLREVWGPSPLD